MLIALLAGLAHFVNDACAGWIIARLALAADADPMAAAVAVLAYDGLAFAFQPLAGWWVDRLGEPKRWAVFGLALSALSAVLVVLIPDVWFVPAIMAGVGSALFHAGGATLVFDGGGDEHTSLFAIFTAPGVIGLGIGTVFVALGQATAQTLVLVALAGVIGMATMRWQHRRVQRAPLRAVTGDRLDLLLILTVAVVALRSTAYSTLEAVAPHTVDMVLLISISAGVGKLGGGLLADRLGDGPATWYSLAAGVGFLMLGSVLPGGPGPPFWLGIACLQASTPITLAALMRLQPRQPGFAAGLALGLGVAIGGIAAGILASPAAAPLVALTPLVALGAIPPAVVALARRPA